VRVSKNSILIYLHFHERAAFHCIVYTYLRHNLQLLALANKRALADSVLQLPNDLSVQRAGGGDGHLNLAAGGGHEGAELLADALKDCETVVGGQGLEELLDGLVGAAGGLLELGDDLLLVLDGERGRGQDLLQASVLLESGSEVLHGLGDGIEGGGLGGCGVLLVRAGSVSLAVVFCVPFPFLVPSLPGYPAITYQRAGVGSINAEERDRRLRIDLCGLGETPRGDGLEARRDGAGAASGDTAGEHVGGNVGERRGGVVRWW
jgi:hypothetical protein